MKEEKFELDWSDWGDGEGWWPGGEDKGRYYRSALLLLMSLLWARGEGVLNCNVIIIENAPHND